MAYTAHVCHGPPLYHVTTIPGPRLTEQLLPKQPESSQQKEEMWSVGSWFVHICSLLPTCLWPKWLTQPYLRPGAGRAGGERIIQEPPGGVSGEQPDHTVGSDVNRPEVPSPAGQRLVVIKNKAVTLSLSLSCSFHLVHEIHPPSSWVCIFFLLLYCHFSCFRNVFNLPHWAKSLPTNHFKRELVGCSLTERWGLSVTITSTLFHHLRLLFSDLKMSMKRSNCAALWEQNYPIWWIHLSEQFSKTALILSILTSAFLICCKRQAYVCNKISQLKRISFWFCHHRQYYIERAGQALKSVIVVCNLS